MEPDAYDNFLIQAGEKLRYFYIKSCGILKVRRMPTIDFNDSGIWQKVTEFVEDRGRPDEVLSPRDQQNRQVELTTARKWNKRI